jgi:hypothetical protein
MPKKTKRPIRKPENLTNENQVIDPLIANRQSSFNPDYHFVIKDLRRVGLLAGLFVMILLVLSILLH